MEKNQESWFEIIVETKQKVRKLKEENPAFDEDTFTKDMLTAMFFERQLETFWEDDLKISLKEEDKLKYVAKLEWLFKSIGIHSSYFCKTPVDETYDAFDDFFSYLICFGYGNLDLRTYDQIFIRANQSLLKRMLQANEEYQDFIFIGKEILFMENLLVEDISELQFLKDRKLAKKYFYKKLYL